MLPASRPLRILMICHDGTIYGSQESLRLIVENLPADGYHCTVSVARPGPLIDVLSALPNVTVVRHERLQWVKHDARSVFQRIGDLLTLLTLALPRGLAIAKLIRQHRIDVVHTNSTVSLEGALGAALTRTPHLWHIRELFWLESPKFHPVLGRPMMRWLIARLSDKAICISRKVQKQFPPNANAETLSLETETDLQSPFPLIYNALDLKPYLDRAAIGRETAARALGVPQYEGFQLVYIGRLSAGKGLHELLEVLVLLLENRPVPAVRLLVAGNFVDASYEARIQGQLAENAALREAVRFLGYQADLGPVYALADLLVVPSREEPFGRVIIEAMAADVVCVGTDSGGIPEIIESPDVGFLYPPGQPDTLAAIVNTCMQSPDRLASIRKNARRMVEKRFTIKRQVEKLNTCYQLVTRHPLPR